MSVFDPMSLAEPIVQAPMAGGPSTVQLALAVCEAGGLGFLAAGYRAADAVEEDIRALRSGTARSFGVNLFVPSAAPADPDRLRPYLAELAPEAERQGVSLGAPHFDDDAWERKLELVCRERVPVVSFTFGLPGRAAIEQVHAAGAAVWVTVTHSDEAVRAERAGADALVVQGTEAGGHRGGFIDDEDAAGSGLLALLRVVARHVSLPLIATGGIADGAGVAAVLCAGAAAAQIGTALMLAPEAGTNEAQRALLAQPVPTRITRAFTGRSARGMVNRFLREHTDNAPVAYPEIHHVTSGLRAAARKRGDADAFNLWAGQAHQLVAEKPAGEIVQEMGATARQVAAEVARRLAATD